MTSTCRAWNRASAGLGADWADVDNKTHALQAIGPFSLHPAGLRGKALEGRFGISVFTQTRRCSTFNLFLRPAAGQHQNRGFQPPNPGLPLGQPRPPLPPAP